ncbi:MAG: ABC transporter substrate-binding protein [Candidatus Sumerlaeaceae bacterium]
MRLGFAGFGTLALVAALSGCDNKVQQEGTPSVRRSASRTQPGSTTSTAATKEDTFMLGVAGPFTGNSSEFGVQIRMGVELFADELNATGGINGRKLKLNIQDDAGNAAQAQTVASTIASNDAVLAVIGHFNSSCSLNGKPIYTQAKMVMFSPGSTNVEVTKNSEYAYRNIFTDDFQGQSLAQYAGNVLSFKNMAILFDNDDYGAGLKDSFKKKAQELGIKIVAEQAYNKEQPDFRSQLTTVHGAQPQPEAILVAGLYNEAANIARQARDIGIKAQFIGGDGVFSQQYITLAGAAAEGAYVTCPFLFDLGGEKAGRFDVGFRKKYHREPDAWAALSYDAISVVCEGIKRNGFTRDAVLQYLKGLDSPQTAYDSLTGKTFFDQEGDCKKPVQVAQVKNGKFVAAANQLGPDGKAVAVRLADESASAENSTMTSATVSVTPAAPPGETSQAAPVPTPAPEPVSTAPTPAAAANTPPSAAPTATASPTPQETAGPRPADVLTSAPAAANPQ